MLLCVCDCVFVIVAVVVFVFVCLCDCVCGCVFVVGCLWLGVCGWVCGWVFVVVFVVEEAEAEEEMGLTMADVKSNNPHLTGGEQKGSVLLRFPQI